MAADVVEVVSGEMNHYIDCRVEWRGKESA